MGSERMKKLINQLQNDNKYDYILFDVPPILGLSDVSIIAEELDGIVLILAVSYVIEMPKESVSSIKLSGGNVLGVLANNMEKPGESSSVSRQIWIWL